MKRSILLFLLFPVVLFAQLGPQLIPGYHNPNAWNQPLDSGYIPGKVYQVNFYSLPYDQSELKLDCHYVIETNDRFMLQKRTQIIDNISEYTLYTKYVTDYVYTNNKLTTMHNWLQKTNDPVLYRSAIDSIVYAGELISKQDRWNFNIDSGMVKHGVGSEYLYNNLARFTEAIPYNLDPQSNIMYTGYFSVDSFSHSSLPANVHFYVYPKNPINQPGIYIIVTYDNLDRIYSITTYLKPNPSLPYIEAEGSLYYYTQNHHYPDSILTYSLQTPQEELSQKKVYTYTASGNISEINTYTIRRAGLVLTNKEEYTTILSTILPENKTNNITFNMLPNPSSGSFSIELKPEDAECTVTITNLLGEHVYKQSYTPTTQIDIALELKPGIYIVNLRNTSGQVSKKLVIQ